MKKTLTAVSAGLALTLTACANDTDTAAVDTTTEETTTTTAAEPEVHSLDDTITLGNTVTISDLEITTEGCEFYDPPTQDAVKFQLVATVENNTGGEILEVLWPTEISFTNPEGFSVSPLDLAPADPPCDNDLPREFNTMADGEKRRAAVTLEAPAGAQEMIYNTTLIEGAEPVRWDIAEEIEGMEVTSPAGAAPEQPAPAPDPTPAQQPPAPQPSTPAQQQAPVIGMTGAPGADTPGPLDKQIQECLTDPTMYQPGTTVFTDGTTGWTEHCASQ